MKKLFYWLKLKSLKIATAECNDFDGVNNSCKFSCKYYSKLYSRETGSVSGATCNAKILINKLEKKDFDGYNYFLKLK